MRISDWSSDVCSSDLIANPVHEYTQLLIDSQPSVLARKPRSPRAKRPATPEPILGVEGLSLTFAQRGLFGGLGRRIVRSVQNVRVTVTSCESFGRVGECWSRPRTITRALPRREHPATGTGPTQ